MLDRVGNEGASSWTLQREQLPSTDMCEAPGLYDRDRNGPAHQTASLLGYQVQRVEGLEHWGAGMGELDPGSRVQISMYVHTHPANPSITPHDKTVPS